MIKSGLTLGRDVLGNFYFTSGSKSWAHVMIPFGGQLVFVICY